MATSAKQSSTKPAASVANPTVDEFMSEWLAADAEAERLEAEDEPHGSDIDERDDNGD
jgi:hypothetical protein